MVKIRKIRINQKKSEKIGKIGVNQGNQNPVQNPIARESDSVQEPGHQIRKIRLNRNKSEKSVSEIRGINENVDLGRHSPENQNISEKSEKSEKVSFSGKSIGENQ